jgi:hypothetical protein
MLLPTPCMMEKNMKNSSNTTTERFECGDRYEAEKLVGVTTMQENEDIHILDVAAVYENEIVIILKDRSYHSILMKDSNNAMRLRRLILEITSGKKNTFQSKFHDQIVEIVLNGSDK